MHFPDTFHSVRFHEIFLRLVALTKVKLVFMELNPSVIPKHKNGPNLHNLNLLNKKKSTDLNMS
jgi:hypothetical protein